MKCIAMVLELNTLMLTSTNSVTTGNTSSYAEVSKVEINIALLQHCSKEAARYSHLLLGLKPAWHLCLVSK